MIKMNLKVFSNLKKPVFAFIMIGASLILFDLQYYLMKNLPGQRDFMCVMGGNFTAENILFSVLMSLLFGLMIAGIVALLEKRSKKLAAGSLSGFALLIGSFTVFCTACTLPFISLFGISIGLSFFTSYNLIFKIVSIILMLVSLYLVNRQLVKSCDCKIKNPNS